MNEPTALLFRKVGRPKSASTKTRKEVNEARKISRLDPARCEAFRRRFQNEIKVVAEYMQINPRELWGRGRTPKLVRARKALARELRGRKISACVIGATMNRDTSTIFHYLGTLQKTKKAQASNDKI